MWLLALSIFSLALVNTIYSPLSENTVEAARITHHEENAVSVVVWLSAKAIAHAIAIPTRRAMLHANDREVVLGLRESLQLGSSRASGVIVE